MAESQLKVAVLGASGRMGAAILGVLAETDGAAVSGASVSSSSRLLGHSLVHAPQAVATSDPSIAVSGAQVAIDFTLPEATSRNLAACVAARCALVLGTTGLSQQLIEEVNLAARQIAIVMAPNMSLGVNLLLQLVEQAAQALDASYDIEIFEAHHRNKKDAPSGTALGLGAAAAAGRNVSLADVAEYARHGVSGIRQRGSIGFSVFRGGDVIGDHTVTFAGMGERIELTHRASDRMGFARGAVKAAQWLDNQQPGLYSMKDVLRVKAMRDA